MRTEKELDKFLSLIYSNNELKIADYLKKHPHIPNNYSHAKLGFPKKVLIEINNSCNLNCKMCFVKSRSHNYLSLHEIADILKEVKKHKSIVSYSSLEPFLRKDFMDIVKLTSKMDISFSILTNGTLIDKKTAEDIIKYKPVSITISLHGTSKVHDQITGVKGSFGKSLSAIKNLLYLKKKFNQKLPFIRINFTVSSLNYKNLKRFVRQFSKYRIDIRINHLMWLDKKHPSQNNWRFKKSLLGYQDYSSGFNNDYNRINIPLLIKILNEASHKKNVTFIPQLKPREIQSWYSDLNFARNKKCLYPFQSIVIDVSGEVHPCAFIRYSYGNIKNKSLLEIWNSKKARSFKRVLTREEILPVCRRCCKL